MNERKSKVLRCQTQQTQAQAQNNLLLLFIHDNLLEMCARGLITASPQIACTLLILFELSTASNVSDERANEN